MKAMMYVPGSADPVAVFDEVTITKFNDNHKTSPYRIAYKAKKLNATRAMLEMHREQKMTLKLDDGRQASVLLQHSSLDMQGNAIGVLRVVGDFQE